MRFIPVSEPVLAGNELRYLTECVETNWVSSTGRFVTEFERSFAAYCGVEHGVAVANGTVALHLALLALGIGPGDEVIVPDVTFAASANAVIHAGATPVLVDIDPATWNLDPARVEERITPRTKAIMVVHLYGNPCDMDAFLDLKARYGLALVEDAAEAHGAEYRGCRAGAFGDVSCFSFFGNKTITCGEGGMCVTASPEVAGKMRTLRDHGMRPERRYWHEEVGYNYRMTNMQAAVGLAQLEQIEGFLRRKIEIARAYRAHLGSALFTFASECEGVLNTHWLSSVLLPHGIDRDAVMAELKARGIDSRPFFYPLHVMPPYATDAGPFSVSDSISARGISLPSGVNLTDEEVAYVAENLKEVVKALYPFPYSGDGLPAEPVLHVAGAS